MCGSLPDDPERLSCSFCGKPEELVRTLIRATAKLDDGRRLCICDDCVSLCVEVLDENATPKVSDPAF